MEIKKIRESLHVSQADFARILCVNRSTVSLWENGLRKISPSHKKMIEMVCNINGVKL